MSEVPLYQAPKDMGRFWFGAPASLEQVKNTAKQDETSVSPDGLVEIEWLPGEMAKLHKLRLILFRWLKSRPASIRRATFRRITPGREGAPLRSASSGGWKSRRPCRR